MTAFILTGLVYEKRVDHRLNYHTRAVGYFAYDWHVKTTILEDDQQVTLYSWTDEKGTKHYTNTQPPDGARNVEENKGYEYSDLPLAIKLKDKIVDGYKGFKEKLFRKKNRKKDKR